MFSTEDEIYHFGLINQNSEAPDSETCTWEECIATIKNNRQLTSQVKLQLRQGIPPRFRPRVWRSLMNHQIVMKLGLYSTLGKLTFLNLETKFSIHCKKFFSYDEAE